MHDMRSLNIYVVGVWEVFSYQEVGKIWNLKKWHNGRQECSPSRLWWYEVTCMEQVLLDHGVWLVLSLTVAGEFRLPKGSNKVPLLFHTVIIILGLTRRIKFAPPPWAIFPRHHGYRISYECAVLQAVLYFRCMKRFWGLTGGDAGWSAIFKQLWCCKISNIFTTYGFIIFKWFQTMGLQPQQAAWPLPFQ